MKRSISQMQQKTAGWIYSCWQRRIDITITALVDHDENQDVDHAAPQASYATCRSMKYCSRAVNTGTVRFITGQRQGALSIFQTHYPQILIISQ